MCAMDLSAGIEKHTLVIDFKGYSIFNKYSSAALCLIL